MNLMEPETETSATPTPAEIVAAAAALAQVCDGAHEQDGRGYNGVDSPTVKSILRSQNPTVRQVRALWNILRKYRKQLEGRGFNYDLLVPPPLPVFVAQAPGAPAAPYVPVKLEVKLLWVETDYGRRIAVTSPYSPEVVAQVKKLEKRWFDKEGKNSAKLKNAWLIQDDVDQMDTLIGHLETIEPAVAIEVAVDLKMSMEGAREGRRQAYAASRAEDAELEIPTKLPLRPFQRAGVKWALDHDGRVMIADQPGLGKTCQALGFLVVKGKESLPALVICPAGLRGNWVREIAKFTDFSYQILTAKSSLKQLQRAGFVANIKPEPGYDITILNYDILEAETAATWVKMLHKSTDPGELEYAHNNLVLAGIPAIKLLMKAMVKRPGLEIENRLNRAKTGIEALEDEARKKGKHIQSAVAGIRVEEFLKLRWKTLVCDESHYLQQTDSQRTMAAMELSKGIKHVLCLTGTPILNRPKELWPQIQCVNPKVWPSFFNFGKEFCVPESAPVLMSDLSQKKIIDVKVGDKVIGWSSSGGVQRRLREAVVLRVMKKRSPLQQVILEDGSSIMSTPDHLWLDGTNTRKESFYTIAREGRQGGAGRNCASRLVRILKFPRRTFFRSKDYVDGYLMGAFRGDGHCIRITVRREYVFQGTSSEGVQAHMVSIGMKDLEPILRVNAYLNLRGIRHSPPNKGRDGIYRVNVGNVEGFRYFSKSGSKHSRAWWAGFLGGIYDAEATGRVIAQDRIYNKVTYEMIAKALRVFDFDIHKAPKSIALRGSRKEMLRFWGLASPALTRRLKSYVFNGGGKFMTERLLVRKIRPISGTRDVYTLTTTTGNYVVYGMGSKNCGGHQTRFGWDFSGSSNLEMLDHQLRTRAGMIRRLKEQVLSELPPKIRITVPMLLDDPDSYEDETKDPRAKLTLLKKAREEWKAVLATLTPEERKRYIAEHAEDAARAQKITGQMIDELEEVKQAAVRAKFDACVKYILDLQQAQGKIIIFMSHHEFIDRMVGEMEKAGLKTAMIDGRVPMGRRDAIKDAFQEGDTQVLVAGIRAASEGLTLTASHTVVFMELDFNPSRHEQAEDRVHRISQKIQPTIYYLVGLGTIEENLSRMIDGKRETVNAALGEGDRTVKEDGIMDAVLEELLA